MQQALTYLPSKNIPLGIPAIFLIVAGLALPNRIGNFDFRHFEKSEGMTISFSRNSPPMAALEDEHLPLVKTEPAQELIITRKSKVIAAGNEVAWKRLEKYAKYFAKAHTSKNSLTSARVIASHKKAAPLLKMQPQGQSPPHRLLMAQKPFTRKKQAYKFTKVSELTRLLVPVREPLRERQLPGLNVIASQRSVAQYAPINTQGYGTPSLRPSVNLNPPNDKRKASESQNNEEQITTTTTLDSSPHTTSEGQWKIQAVQDPPTSPKALRKTADNLSTKIGDKSVDKNVDNFPTISLPTRSMNSLISQKDSQKAFTSRIIGQIELAGGLALTGLSTHIQVLWKTSGKTLEGIVDYSSGTFYVDVPHLNGGKLFASLVDNSSRVLGESIFDIDGAATDENQTLLEGVKLIIQPQETSVKGRVVSAYSVDTSIIPVKHVDIFSAANARTTADGQGQFHLTGINSDSTFVLEAYAQDHWGTRVIGEGNRKIQFPLFHGHMLQSFFDLIEKPDNNTEFGVIWGEIKRHGKSKEGVEVALASGDAVGPIYFNSLRIPDKNMKATGSNGLYAFVKVKPGLHLVTARYGQQELPSSVASVSASMVAYTEISFKTVELKGQVQNPIDHINVPAQISVVGASQYGMATEKGFHFKIPSSDPVLFIEANPGPEYLISREAVSRTRASQLALFAFKKSWMNDELKHGDLSHDQNSGLLIGYVTGPGFHVTLDSETNSQNYSEQNIGYFGKDGHVESGRIDGIAGGSGFIMTNLPPGLHTLVITSAEGEMVSSRLFVSEPGILNVMNINLRP